MVTQVQLYVAAREQNIFGFVKPIYESRLKLFSVVFEIERRVDCLIKCFGFFFSKK